MSFFLLHLILLLEHLSLESCQNQLCIRIGGVLARGEFESVSIVKLYRFQFNQEPNVINVKKCF